jgi:hypothetical protein
MYGRCSVLVYALLHTSAGFRTPALIRIEYASLIINGFLRRTEWLFAIGSAYVSGECCFLSELRVNVALKCSFIRTFIHMYVCVFRQWDRRYTRRIDSLINKLQVNMLCSVSTDYESCSGKNEMGVADTCSMYVPAYLPLYLCTYPQALIDALALRGGNLYIASSWFRSGRQTGRVRLLRAVQLTEALHGRYN